MAYLPLHLSTEGGDGRRLGSVAPEPWRPRNWTYMTTDSVATVRVAGYISNGFQMGMRPGDTVRVVVATGTWPAVTITAVSSCLVMTCTAAAGADLADGTTLSVTNSD